MKNNKSITVNKYKKKMKVEANEDRFIKKVQNKFHCDKRQEGWLNYVSQIHCNYFIIFSVNGKHFESLIFFC